MKIRIIEPGWANFSDHFGSIAFENGVSVEEVSRADAAYLAGLVQIETVEDEGVEARNPSPTQQLLDAHVKPAEVKTLQRIPEVPATVKVWTEGELSAIADEKGINGVREIAEPMGVKDNSITGLIAKILAKQAEPKPAADAAQV